MYWLVCVESSEAVSDCKQRTRCELFECGAVAP